MKQLLAFFLLIASGLSAQDTITSYINLRGIPTDFSVSSYFRKQTANGTWMYKPVSHTDVSKAVYVPKNLGMRNGQYIFMDSASVVRMEAAFLNDTLEGITKKFFASGQLSDSCVYAYGKLAGTSTYFYPNGQIASVELYKEGELQSAQLFHEDGSLDTVSEGPYVLAEFPGGIDSMKTFLSRNIVYPKGAIELELQGRCFLMFKVGADGSVSEVKIQRGIADCPECDREAIRVVKSMPNWKPGKVHNRIEATYYNLPISFILTSAKEDRRAKRGKK